MAPVIAMGRALKSLPMLRRAALAEDVLEDVADVPVDDAVPLPLGDVAVDAGAADVEAGAAAQRIKLDTSHRMKQFCLLPGAFTSKGSELAKTMVGSEVLTKLTT